MRNHGRARFLTSILYSRNGPFGWLPTGWCGCTWSESFIFLHNLSLCWFVCGSPTNSCCNYPMMSWQLESTHYEWIYSYHVLIRASFQSRVIHLCQYSWHVSRPCAFSAVFSYAINRHKNFAPKLNGRYLSSNVNITLLDEHDNIVNVPVGSTWKWPVLLPCFSNFVHRPLLQIQDQKVRELAWILLERIDLSFHRGRKVTALGVLFNFAGNDKNTTVQKVADMVKEQWFADAIKDEPDFFLLVGWDCRLLLFGNVLLTNSFVKTHAGAKGQLAPRIQCCSSCSS